MTHTDRPCPACGEPWEEHVVREGRAFVCRNVDRQKAAEPPESDEDGLE